jgi:hypothetical protein
MSVLRTLVNLLVISATVLALLTESTKSIDSIQDPGVYVKIIRDMGRVGPDGTLRFEIPLAINRPLGINFRLVHSIGSDAYGSPCSTWKLTGLSSSVESIANGLLKWKSVDGSICYFHSTINDSQFVAGIDGQCAIRKDCPGVSIRDEEMRIWYYVDGALVSVQIPGQGYYRFICEGEDLREIFYEGEHNKSLIVLAVVRNQSHNITIINDRAGCLATLTWENYRKITKVGFRSGPEVNFTYKNNIIKSIEETGNPPLTLEWEENNNYRRGNSRWLSPVCLVRDDQNVYKYSISSHGIMCRSLRLRTQGEIVTLFNPSKQELIQYGSSIVGRRSYTLKDYLPGDIHP